MSQKIDLGLEDFSDGDTLQPPPLEFKVCARHDHNDCRPEHRRDEHAGTRVVQLRRGEIEKLSWDPLMGSLDIWLRPSAD